MFNYYLRTSEAEGRNAVIGKKDFLDSAGTDLLWLKEYGRTPHRKLSKDGLISYKLLFSFHNRSDRYCRHFRIQDRNHQDSRTGKHNVHAHTVPHACNEHFGKDLKNSEIENSTLKKK